MPQVIGFPGVMVALIVAVLSATGWPLAIWLGVWLAAWVQVVIKVPLLPLSDAQAAQNRRFGHVFVVVLALVACVGWWFTRH